jgi:hypothetical protein
VGVPWQDIARKNPGPDGKPGTPDDYPDLLDGLDISGKALGGFQSGAELAVNGVWDIILGDPSKYVLPTDPLMIESVLPRTGTNPVTGDAVQPPGSSEGANPINGHEYNIPAKDDLQYACTFPLYDSASKEPTIRDCTDPNEVACDCADKDNANQNPLCDPATPTNQKYAKAYPGLRELQVVRLAGTQGIVGSICPEQQADSKLFNFGYRPAIGAIIERLKLVIGRQCLPQSLTPNAAGQVSCLILEASNSAACDCSSNGREPIDPSHPAVKAAKEDPLAEQAKWNCFCQISQTVGEDLEACQTVLTEPVVNKSGKAVHGWCYIDATTMPPTGDPEIVENCPATERRLIRFVGDAQPRPSATLFIACAD